MEERIFKFFLIVIMTISLFLFVLLINIQYVAFNTNFYKNEFVKNNIMATTKMELGELMNVIEIMHQYLAGKEKSLDIQVQINGNLQRMFNDRELEHMEDVKNLFNIGFVVKDISLIIFVIIFTYFLFTQYFYKMSVYFLRGIVVILIFLAILALGAIMDFDKWFTGFHLVFFTNDLWQLDVETDRLIQMFPLNFFQKAVFLIFRNTVSTFAILFLAIVAILKMTKRPV